MLVFYDFRPASNLSFVQGYIIDNELIPLLLLYLCLFIIDVRKDH